MQKINTAALLACAGMMFFSATAISVEEEAATLEQARQRFGAADADLNKTFQELRSKLREMRSKICATGSGRG